jgi:methyl-accepting chemotaxis protein
MLVSSIGEGLEQLAKGNLVARVNADLTGPFAKLKTDFNNAVSSLQSTLSLVSQSGDGIRWGSGDISQASLDLSQRTEQQAASLEETASAMNEITSTVKLAASNAVEANTAVGEAMAAGGGEQLLP